MNKGNQDFFDKASEFSEMLSYLRKEGYVTNSSIELNSGGKGSVEITGTVPAKRQKKVKVIMFVDPTDTINKLKALIISKKIRMTWVEFETQATTLIKRSKSDGDVIGTTGSKLTLRLEFSFSS